MEDERHALLIGSTPALRRTLETACERVTTVEGGHAACEWLQGHRPDLVVIGPPQGGWATTEVLWSVLQAGVRAPVVVQGGAAARALGATHCLAVAPEPEQLEVLLGAARGGVA